ncbi:YdcH family protein [Paraglaciecola sp. L3A3]|uniref:YdcH family protein n=1 Tax=Paraglaciecola sp. L3A3 TaxID=2686358 RepID=UPI00131E0ACE|nr:DUF465 domain-containing protein [Paraglaciecola sp. L3A3]
MQIEKHSLLKDFPEHHHTIRHLKMHDAHFTKLFDSYHELEHEVHNIETSNSPVEDDFIESLKKKRLHLKDELLSIIKTTEQKL